MLEHTKEYLKEVNMMRCLLCKRSLKHSLWVAWKGILEYCSLANVLVYITIYIHREGNTEKENNGNVVFK
jgi:hypothetical protein